MLQTAGRLTLYGLISCIDADLRMLVASHVIMGRNEQELLGTSLFDKLRLRAEKDGHFSGADLHDYLDFGDSLAILRANANLLSSTLAKFVKNSGPVLDRLVPVRNRVMHARPILLTDYAIGDECARKIKETGTEFFPNTVSFYSKVREDPHHVFSIDMSKVDRNEDRIPNNLPLPDFDETGFIGRDQEKKELRRLCDSQWPVVTIVGEGGYGKSALALQVAYDVLDDEASEWDAIVWATAKRIRLTLNDIETIEGAVTSSLGLIQNAARELSGQNSANPSAELVEYLNSFKVLLFLDNLETVLDPILQSFLRQLNGRSKIIATSRVGVGELSYNFNLKSMSQKDACRLLRGTASARGVDDLATAPQTAIEHYCKRMKLNAGFIKWFVTCVQYGKRPDEVLANPRVFLDFCVSYVYEHVSEDAKLVTKAMLAAPGKQSLPLIAYLTGLSGDRLEIALASLQAANILKMSTSFNDETVDTTYELSELPRLYILKNHPPSAIEDTEFKRRKREVVGLFDRLQVERSNHRYDPRNIACRNPSDSVSAKLLIDALDSTRRGQFEAALDMVRRAAELDPSFPEVYRVEAYVHFWAGNQIAAEDSYETAISYDPNSSPLRYWYGGFLLRASHDPGRAKIQFCEAQRIDPSNPRISIELSRAHMHLGEFEAANDVLDQVLKLDTLALKERRIAFHIFLQNYVRWAQRFLAHGDYEKAIETLGSAIGDLKRVPREWVDGRIRSTLTQMMNMLPQTGYLSGRADVAETLVRDLDSVLGTVAVALPMEVANETAERADVPSDDVQVGIVRRIVWERGFGFIEHKGGPDLFFHFSQVHDEKRLALDAEVSFRVGLAKDGRPVATKVKCLKEIPHEVAIGERLKGNVKGLAATYGFVFAEDGHDYFFHQNNLDAGLSFSNLREGDLVEFVLEEAAKGPVAGRLNRLE